LPSKTLSAHATYPIKSLVILAKSEQLDQLLKLRCNINASYCKFRLVQLCPVFTDLVLHALSASECM